MENTTQNPIAVLAVELDVYLSELGYAEETLKPFRRVWKLVSDYANKERLSEADTLWVAPLVVEHYKNNARAVADMANHACKLLCEFQKARTTGVAPRWMTGAYNQSFICDLSDGVAEYLLSKGYAQKTIRHFRHVWNQMADYAYENNYQDIEDAWIREFLRVQYGISDSKLSSTKRTYKRAALILRDFQKLGEVSHCSKRLPMGTADAEYQCLFDSVLSFCNAKNFSASTTRHYAQRARHLVTYLSEHSIGLEDLSVNHMREYFISLSNLAASTIGLVHYVLRNILHMAYTDGCIAIDLSVACEKPRALADCKIPSAYPPEDVEALLNSVDRESPTGKRDYAILLIGARLGLRAGDIRKLTFDSFNWGSKEIRIVQEKTSNALALPFSDEIGWAIIDYLKNGRPATDSKCIFLRHRAPFTPFGPTNSLGAIIGKYFRRANIRIPEGKKHGMHILRHSLASNMLAAGVSLPTLTEVLDHSDGKTTMHYIKIDIPQLRGCALEADVGGDCR